jgi:hypothetical protein
MTSGTSGRPPGYIPTQSVRAILRTVADADVVYIAFPRLGHALVFDFRASAVDAPTVLAAPYEVAAERQVSVVEALRPGFPTIVRFVGVPWGGSTRAFIEQGVFPALLSRLPAASTEGAMAALEQLRRAERGDAE